MRKAAGIAPSTLTKMKKDEDVSLRVLGKICKALDCDLKDMAEYIEERGDPNHGTGKTHQSCYRPEAATVWLGNSGYETFEFICFYRRCCP